MWEMLVLGLIRGKMLVLSVMSAFGVDLLELIL
jgi:hypothetical protein